MTRHLATLALALLTALPAAAQEAASPGGHWQGAIVLPNGKLEVAVDLMRGAEGGWTGYLDITAQGLNDLALVDIAVEGTAVAFGIAGLPGDPAFKGTLSEDGKTLTGDYSQGGGSFPFELARTSAEPEPPAAKPPTEAWTGPGVPGEGVVGSWRGVIEIGSTQLRLALDIAKNPEGDLTGELDSVDQGAKLPVDRVILFARSFKFEMARLLASYEGLLAEDGSEIVGQWTQAGSSLPLTFKRFVEPAQ